MATVNKGSRAAEIARQRAAEAAKKAAAEAARKAAAEAARKAAAEAAKKAAAEAAKKAAAEAAKKAAAEAAKLKSAVQNRMGAYTKPLQEAGQGKGTGPLNHAGKASTQSLNKAAEKAPAAAGKAENQENQTLAEKAKDMAAEKISSKIDKRESRVEDAKNKFSTVLKKTLPGKILATPEKFKGVVTKGKEAIDKAREGDVVGAVQAAKEAKGSLKAGVGGITAAASIVSKVKEAAEGPSAIKKMTEGLKGGAKALVDDAKDVVKKEFSDATDLVKGGVKKNAKSIAEYAGENGVKGITKKALKSDTAAKAASEGVEKGVKKVAAVLGQEAAEKVATSAATKSAAKIAGKAGGRFVPGVNIAIAAVDTKHAVDVLRDKNASGWQKTMASVTAVGSIAAATNIPVVSQMGAAVSIAGSVAEVIKPESVVNGAKAAFKGAKKFIGGLFAG